MRFIADFHIHSKYSRATSRNMDLENLDKWARIKGIDVLGTGDFTHPLWLKELKTKLEPAEPGLFKLRQTSKIKLNNGWLPPGNQGQVHDLRYILTTELSCIYQKGNRTYKIHLMIFVPSLDVVEKINAHLGWLGNLKADGRPILGLDAKELAKIVLNISSDALIVPAHAWTPHFSIFGSESGFDSIEECFDEYAKYIYAIETGLSSDPLMNWRLSALDKITLISNSDAHCVHPETNIYTIYGKPKPIKDLNPSRTLSIDFVDNLKQVEAKISKLHKLPSPPILYKIATRTKEIITTPEHRFFVLENEEIVEKKASELRKNDLVACLRQISNQGRSKRLPSFDIDHEIKISSGGVDYLRRLRLKNKKTQKDVGEYIGVNEDCIWMFEKYKVKTPKESFIDKYCECFGIDKNKFKKKFIISRFPSEKSPDFTNEKFCQILGYMLGDGGIGHSEGEIRNLDLTDKDIDLLSRYQNLIKEVFNITGRRRKKKGNSNAIRYPAYLAKYFQKIDSKILISSPERQIPEFIFGLPKQEIAAFLKGLFDAEGTNADHSIQISSSSLTSIKEVQVLLLKFGINSNIYHDFEKKKKKWRYKISIYGQEQLKKFSEEIGFDSVFKKEKLSKYLFLLRQNSKNCFVDPLPFQEEILRIKKTLGVSCYDIPKRLYYHLARNDTLKRNNVKEFIEIFLKYPQINPLSGKIEKFVDSDIIWEPMQEIKKVKSDCEFVYDLTVPGYENYVANGFITHNSPQKIGREANIFEGKIEGYKYIIEALRLGWRAPASVKNRLIKTIEFFPEEGKYHYDGHRNCKIVFGPEETIKNNGICPVCGRPITVGVMSRVQKLADRPVGFKPVNSIPFLSLIPLEEIIAESFGVGVGTKTVEQEYKDLINKFGNEFKILMEAGQAELANAAKPEVAEGILRVREGRVKIEPGYDGEYGKIKIFDETERENFSKQSTLF